MKTVYILSGCSGSGKSTWANKFEAPRMVSADSYFMKGQSYDFDPTKLDLAHGECMRKFVEYCQEGLYTVIVDNTNTTVAEIAPYYSVGRAYGYEIVLKTFPVGLYLNDPYVVSEQVAYERNVHRVPLASIQNQLVRLNGLKLPCFWKIKQE